MTIVKTISRRWAIIHAGPRLNAAKEIAFFVNSIYTKLPQTILKKKRDTESILFTSTNF